MKNTKQPWIKPTSPPLKEALRVFFEAGKAKWLYLFGIFLTLVFAWDLKSNWAQQVAGMLRSDAWATTQGTIQQSIAIRIPGGTKSQTRIQPIIKYAYHVANVEYESELICFCLTSSSKSYPGYAEHYIGKYPVGKQVTVYYWPRNPQVAILEVPANPTFANYVGDFI